MICTRRAFGLSLLWACSSAGFVQAAESNYRKRRIALAERTRGGAVVIFSEPEPKDVRVQFRQDSNFYYLTGWLKPGAALLIKPGHPARGALTAQPYEEILFVPGRNAAREQVDGPMVAADDPRATAITGVDRVESLSALGEEILRLAAAGSTGLYVPRPNAIPEMQTGPDSKDFRQALKLWRGRLIDAEPTLKSMRMAKDQQEMVLIRKAIDASIAGHFAAMRALRPGSFEYEIAALVQYQSQMRGCERLAYPAIVGSGINAAYGHHNANSTQVKDGDLVLIDVGGEYSMYAADITRTLPANGKFTSRQKDLYEVVLGAQQGRR